MEKNKNCRYCGISIENKKGTKYKYCSQECYHNFNKGENHSGFKDIDTSKYHCKFCNEELKIKSKRDKTRIPNGSKKFCDKICQGKYNTGERNGIHKYVKRLEFNPKLREKRSIEIKELYKNGKMKSWNEGKTYLEDTRIRHGEQINTFNNWSSLAPYDKNFDKLFKNAIRKRDNQVCMNCGVHREKLSKSLAIHHIDYNKENSIEQNCLSLCSSCHSLTNINRDYWKSLFQSKLNRLYNYQYTKEGDITLKI